MEVNSFKKDGTPRLDAFGNPAVNMVDAGQVIAAALTPTLKVLPGGIHTSLAITGGNSYRVDSDVDLFVKSSSAAAQYEAVLTNNTDSYTMPAGAAFAALTELNFGTGNITLEAWVKIDPAHTNDHFISLGNGSDDYLEWYLTTSSSNIKSRIRMGSNLGLDEWGGGFVQVTSSVEAVATELHHVVWTIDRTTPEQKFYIDGALVTTSTTADLGNAVAPNTATSGLATLGASLGAAPRFGGSILDVKFYKELLTITQVQARTNQGPVTLQAEFVNDGSVPTTWVSMAHSATWTDANEPEGTIGGLVFSNTIGAPVVGEVTTGTAAGTGNSQRVLASTPTIVNVGPSDTYLNLYSVVGAAGNAYITGG